MSTCTLKLTFDISPGSEDKLHPAAMSLIVRLEVVKSVDLAFNLLMFVGPIRPGVVVPVRVSTNPYLTTGLLSNNHFTKRADRDLTSNPGILSVYGFVSSSSRLH